MLIRRLSEALRRQDWFVVLIEILIVAVGIVAGLQANEWAQECTERNLEQAALERLFQEANVNHQMLAYSVQREGRLNQLRRNAVQFADSDEPVPAEDLPLRIGINTLAMFPPIIPVSATFDELKSSGQYQLIRSAALRTQIAGFHSGMAELNRQLDSFTDSNDRFFEIYQQHVIWNYNPDSTTTDILLSTYDWDTLRADERFIFQIIGLLRNQLVIQEYLVDMRNQARSMCESLRELVDADGQNESCEQID